MSVALPNRRITLPRAHAILACLLLIAGLHLLDARAMPLAFVAADSLGAASSEAADGPGAATKRSGAESNSDQRSARLFDMETEPVVAGDILDKWRRVKADIGSEFEALQRCRAAGPCPPAAQRLIDITAEGAGKSGRARVGLINRAVDLAIAPTSDERQWGVADHWSAPFETLQSSRGDCEDYAIVKYVALLEAGMSADDVKIVILKNLLPRENHAAVAVRVDGEWLILDNLTLILVRDTDMVRSIPEFVLDQDGARRFVWTSRSRRSAAHVS
jgi:predicted transglutaminase-like cysteine proteinase